jgi:hypothetical protein
MNATAGIVLLVVFVAMLWFGKPRKGVPRPFMRSWIVGMGYTMICLLTFVLGVTAIIFSLR